MNEYATHLLCYGKGADMVFSSTATPQCPGSPFSGPDRSDCNVILAGGFPAIHPDSPFPLSPTLQLNGDLANCSNDDMAAIGRGEFVRSNSQSFRSYVLEADPRVTVLGAEPDCLHEFLDSYSGILEIEPLLLEAYDPDLTTVHDLEIAGSTGGEHQLSFTVRQPVDLEKCSYCGSCGPVCSQHCLSERLYLDFSQCTLCNECVNVCPQQAIDLHAIEKRVLLTPALLLLEGTRVNLPRSTDNIYTEKDLHRLFHSIYSARVEEVVSCNRTICQYSAKLDTGCENCRSACTYGAVSRDRDGIHIDHLLCTECGACLASCPTGALQYGRFTDASFVEYFRTVALEKHGTVVLGNEQELHRFWWRTKQVESAPVFFLEYPQPMALSSMHLLLLYCMGAGRIIVLAEDNKASASIRRQITLVNTILNTLFHLHDPVLCTGQNVLAAELERNSAENPLARLYHDFSFTNRREKLADMLSFLCLQSEAEAVRLSGAAVADFGEITCDRDKCTLCSACAGECRIAALTTNSSNFSLNHSPALCTQCGTCVDICPEDAITLQPGLPLHPDFFKTTVLAQAEPVHCLECGKIFGTRESLTKIMTILTRKNMWDSDDNLLNYCETCRVVKLFESHEK